MRAFPRMLLLVALSVSPLACGGDDDPAAPAPIPWDEVGLAVSRATSLSPVRVNGLPQQVDPATVVAVFDAPGVVAFEFALESDAIGPFFHAPLHPSTPNDGGTITVRLTDGTTTSAPLALELDALPEAPGAFARVVEALRAHVEQRALWASTNFDGLASLGFGEIDALLLPLKVAQTHVDAGTAGSLASLVANENAVLTDDERELLDRVFGYAPLDVLVRADIDSFARLTPAKVGLGRAVPISSALRDCIDRGPDIGTAQQLSDAMLASALANTAIDPQGEAGAIFDALSVLVTGLGIVPGVSKVASVVGVGLAAWKASLDFVGALYPSQLVSLDFDLDKAVFAEDDTDPARWSNVKVIAASTGGVLDKSLANLLVSMLGAHLSLNQKLAVAEAEVYRDIGVAALNPALGDYLDEQGGIIEFCAKTWDVDISSLPFSTGQVLDRRFSVDPATQEVRPLQVGSDVLRIAAQPSKFAGRTAERDRPIETRAIGIDLIPDDIVVENPGETVQIEATIANAKVQSLYWNPGAGSWEDGIGDDTNGPATRPLKTPTSTSAYPFNVVVESTSRQGLRESGEPTRAGTATVRLGRPGIVIEPSFACIQPGETQQFDARVTGIENPSVTWRLVSGFGTLDQTGLYRAPSVGTTEARIEASVDGYQDAVAHADVAAQGCVCSFQAQIRGAYGWDGAGADVAYGITDLGELFYTFYFEPAGGDQVHSLVVTLAGSPAIPAPRPGETGNWRVEFTFIAGESGWTTSSADEDAGVVLTIDELTETFMTGTLSGTAVQRGEQGAITSTILVSIPFRAGYWDGGEWPCQ